MQEFLITLSTEHIYWAYFLIVFIAILEGPILSILLGIILKLGFFSPVPIIGVLMAGDIIGDIIWYGIGRRYGMRFVAKFGKYFDVTEANIDKLMVLFHRHSAKILFVSKVSNGFGFALAVLMTAGMIRIPFSKYVTVNVIGQVIWTSVLVGTGYFFGHMYETFDSLFGYISTTALAVAVFMAFKGYKNYLKKKAKQLEL